MNITHDNDELPVQTKLTKMRAIKVIKSGDTVVIRDMYNDYWIAVHDLLNDFKNHAMMCINKKGIKIDCYAEISDTEIIFLTKNFDIKL